MAGSTPERWQAIAGLLEAAMEKTPEERAAFLSQVCGQDAALRQEVEALLQADASAQEFLESPADVYVATLLDEIEAAGGAEPEELAGQSIGPYRIVGELGRGGMGVVLLAARADGQFEQQVAIKLLKRGLDSDEILRRFLHERQTLARLRHPAIARLLDGGLTTDGRPYFAMEHVEGESLTTYCDSRRLGVTERLRLFATVCGAVQYAHRNLVVHRDLKPSNILVTGEGEVKLLDFGIAKLLAEEGSETTRTGIFLGTPHYAAPEQISGQAVTTATDVWGLGVVLYELLAGRRPFSGLGQGALELARAILQARPEAPSLAIHRAAAQPNERDGVESTARARGMSVRALERRLAGDLDTIVLAALRQEPERRYTSVEALAEDISRHLDGRPVAARRDSLGYRAGKFLRRHRLGVAASLALLGSLLGGLLATAWQARVAALEAERARAVTAFLVETFSVSDPEEARGERITAREILDRGAARLADLASEPEIQAEMLQVIGSIYRKLGLYQPAKPLLEESLALRQQLHGSRHGTVAASLAELAHLRLDMGDYATAEAQLRAVLAMRRDVLGVAHSAVATTLRELGDLMKERGSYEEAEALLREALALQRRIYGEEHAQVAATLNALGNLFEKKEDYAAAEPLLRESLGMCRRVYGENHPAVEKALHNLASLLLNLGKYDEAEPLFRQGLALARRLYGAEHPAVALTLSDLGLVLHSKGDYTGAQGMLEEALAIRRKVQGDDHPDTLMTMSDLAGICFLRGDYERAGPLNRQSLAGFERVFGEDHRNTLMARHNLASLLLNVGSYDEAEPLLRQNLELRRRLAVSGDDLASSLNALASLLVRRGSLDEAASLHAEALEVRRAHLGDDHPQVGAAQLYLGGTLRRQGRFVEAEPHLAEALRILRAAHPQGHSTLADAIHAMGELRLDTGRFAEAEPLLLEALAMRVEKMVAGDWRIAEAQLSLGVCLQALGRPADAEPLLRRSLETLEHGRDPRQLAPKAKAALADLDVALREREPHGE